MRRREFIAGLGIAAAWPLAARAQQAAIPVIGLLYAGLTVRSPNIPGPAFLQGLSEMGYVEGRNVAIEYLGADQYDQLLALAADLVRRKMAVIYASGTANSAMAAKAATTTIPIVFSNGSDPIRVGLVPSLSRPGGNITGVTLFISEVVVQRLQYLRELVPAAAVGTIGFLTSDQSYERTEYFGHADGRSEDRTAD
jgi:putative ABC transport system substrate-binding protein